MIATAVGLQGYDDSITPREKGQIIAGLPQGCYKNAVSSLL